MRHSNRPAVDRGEAGTVAVSHCLHLLDFSPLCTCVFSNDVGGELCFQMCVSKCVFQMCVFKLGWRRGVFQMCVSNEIGVVCFQMCVSNEVGGQVCFQMCLSNKRCVFKCVLSNERLLVGGEVSGLSRSSLGRQSRVSR